MKAALYLLLISALALFAAGAGVSGSAVAAPMQDAMAAEQVGMGMADCDHCPTEQMQSGVYPCGSLCVAPAVAVLGTSDFRPAFSPTTGFPVVDEILAGQVRRPELTPPRFS